MSSREELVYLVESGESRRRAPGADYCLPRRALFDYLHVPVVPDGSMHVESQMGECVTFGDAQFQAASVSDASGRWVPRGPDVIPPGFGYLTT